MNSSIFEQTQSHANCSISKERRVRVQRWVDVLRGNSSVHLERADSRWSISFSRPSSSVGSMRRPACRDEQPVERVDWAVRLHEFREYVDALSQVRNGEQLISCELARTALKVWWKFYGSWAGELSVPDVGPGTNGDLIFIWKRDGHYLSVEMPPGSPADIFYRNDRTGAIWGVEFDPNDRNVPEPLVEKLSFFLDKD